MRYIQGKPIAVIKVGGDILLDPAELSGLVNNVSDLISIGWHCVVLHGGGPQVSRLQALHGLTENKVGGRRITSKADLEVVKQALCGEANVNLVSALASQEINAFGCHGASGKLIAASRRAPRAVSGSQGEIIDFGEVGDVVGVNGELLRALLELNLVPVIASLGIDDEGAIFNINGDTTAVQIARTLQAGALILTTQIGGIFRDITDASSRIATITSDQAAELIEAGVIRDGMIPKVEEIVGLANSGVARVAITNAANKSSFVDVIHQKTESGTRFLSD